MLPPDTDKAAPTSYVPENIKGSDKFKAKIRDICKKYTKVFNTKLTRQPALVAPMKLHVNEDIWQTKGNQGQCRAQTNTKQEEIRKQVLSLEQLEVIRISDASWYSQVHMQPKPSQMVNVPNAFGDQLIMTEIKKWRFCIDFRNLNLATDSTHHGVLPKIPDMLQRFQKRKSRFFGKLDMTTGYYQAPLDLTSQKYTAFQTHMGVYHWNRVPMGLKGAPSYFQGVMANEVLRRLMYNSCELYLDDILIFGDTEEEFCSRLEQVLKRLLDHKITVNPEKVELGLDEVEFVGHVLNAEGLHFSREKLDKVLQIPVPIFGKELKSFLGVCVYFKDHIAHYSDHVRLLHHMIRDYDKMKSRRLIWTDAAMVAFHTIKQMINDLPFLFFSDDNAEIFLRTDASDYGIGAYLYQIKDGKEIPVGFMSKMLSDTERRWNVTEKECYAIVAAFDKFYYTLRDRKFILQTDHRNLQFMDKSSNAKVVRWKMMISEFDCIVEHIPGRVNVVADGFSRILQVPEEECNMLTGEHKLIAVHPSRGFADLHALQEEELSALYDFFIPIEERDKIEKAHNSSVGHFGLERTLDKLDKLKFQWKYRREHVKRFIKECPHCQKQSYLKIPICTHPFTLAAYKPMERLAIDTIGPLPKSDNEYEHILVVLDCFTRWVELYPLKDVTALPAAKALINHFATFSQPSQIIHDNGSQFKNELLTEILELTGVQQVPILAYSSEENGMVERANREVMRHLRAIIFDKNIINDWEEHLPQVKRIMNSAKHNSTGVSPSQLLFGNSIQLDPCILEPKAVTKEGKDRMSKWASSMLQAQYTMTEIARKLQLKRDAEYMDRATEAQLTRSHSHNFGIGTYVLADYKTSKYWKGPPNKLMTNRRGPLKIIAIEKDVITLENLVTRRNEKHHITNLTPFLFNPLVLDPLDVARKDYHSTFIIEKILEHVGGPKDSKSKWDFKVRWLGYDETDDSWIPYSEVRDNALFHDYVRTHKLPKLFIPEKHRTEADKIRRHDHERPTTSKRGRPLNSRS